MAALGTSVLEELTERFEADPEKFTKRELMDLFTTMADRSIATAKGGPTPQQALQVAGPGGAGLALQINFVSTTATQQDPIEAQVVNVLPAKGVRGEDKGQTLQGAVGLDGEIDPPYVPTHYPSPAEIQEARYDATDRHIAEREEEIASRQKRRIEMLLKGASAPGERKE